MPLRESNLPGHPCNFRCLKPFTSSSMHVTLQRGILQLVLHVAAVGGLLMAQSATVAGVVLDAATGEPLPAATVRVIGTARGTIANADGSYRLSLPLGTYRVAATFVGYRPDTALVRLNGSMLVDFRLDPAPIRMAEVVVSGDDPAIAIMRRVIEEKQRWRAALLSYQFEAFTRQVLRRDTAIASIMETYSTGFWRQGDTLREVIRQKRQTQNMKMDQNFAAVGEIVNFYEDEIRFAGYRFVGPTAPDAFDYYDFRLDRSFRQDGNTIFVIQLRPNSRVTPLFDGEVQVVDDRFVLAGIDVKPNEAFILPFISDFAVRTRQQFAPIQDRYWLPIDIRTTLRVSVSIPLLQLPTIGFESTSSIYEYRVNEPVPDSLFQQRRIQQDSSSKKFDSTYWAQREVLPLTIEQTEAYRSLDSTQTLDKTFRPSGLLADADSSAWLDFLSYADLRFNRVQGGFLGARYTSDTLWGRWRWQAGAGYGFAGHRWSVRGGISTVIDRDRRLDVGADGYRDVSIVANAGKHLELKSALTSLLYKNDYFDYLDIRGATFWVALRPSARVDLRLDLRAEEHRSASANTSYSLFSRSSRYRAQPTIDEGDLRSAMFTVRLGREPVPLNLIHVDRASFSVEVADRALLGGDLQFMRWMFEGGYRIPTYYDRSPFGSYLALYASAGIATGRVPVQRLFSLETQSSSFAPPGVLKGAAVREFAGDRFASLTIEHNFRSAFFLWLGIPYLYKNGYETIVSATAASSSFNTRSSALGVSTPGVYSEAGLAINKILQLLRLDFFYRFTAPRGLHLTMAISQLL